MMRLVSVLTSGDENAKRRIFLLGVALLALNVGGWGWAISMFQSHPALLGVAALVYGLGLRHAVDADHIAAIDNVARKLTHEAQQAASTGFWFAIGHSSVVVLVTLAVITAAKHLDAFEAWREVGGTLSIAISAGFLLLVAIMNFAILHATINALRRVRAGERIDDGALDLLFSGRGPMSRLFRPAFRAIGKPWQMAPLGFLFGLSFDTATEVALFALSAAQVSSGMPLHAILVFPILFAAGMTLVDTADGILMVSAYRWAAINPLRKLYYNMTITLMSIAVALFIGGVELAVLSVRLLGLEGPLAVAAQRINDSFNILGFGIIAAFLLAWMISHQLYHRFSQTPAEQS
ncbi:HoxN/HupN/NixA family nickel/cobalt transporter [uncultured Hyphomonas sp.]|uniref:HoxN/HupN/NixA family nickel/cobalt transporter n=1 Tax=uncultured Hyphomonas sp. TaxID=225298 RepID=UPI002AAAB948|nr:HoxN/HupN/NixA family nickel/cobalt transporter [uncultured Hyphomonas sp.]